MAIFWFYGEIHIKEVVGDDTPTVILDILLIHATKHIPRFFKNICLFFKMIIVIQYTQKKAQISRS
jgi:hypothetical protein